MVERFLFDGVDILGNEFAISMGIKNAGLILPDVAPSIFSVRDSAVVIAQKASNFTIFNRFIKERFFQHLLAHCALSDRDISPKNNISQSFCFSAGSDPENTVFLFAKYRIDPIYFSAPFA